MKKLFLFLILFATLEGVTPFRVIYHGSPNEYEKVIPKKNIRFDRQGKKVWEKTGIFASYDPRIPLFYTYSRFEGYDAFIDLEEHRNPNDPITFELVGGKSKEETIEKLFGPLHGENVGYIYLLDDRQFTWHPELGSMERICHDDACNIGVTKIHRRKELELYRKTGMIKIHWRPS